MDTFETVKNLTPGSFVTVTRPAEPDRAEKP